MLASTEAALGFVVVVGQKLTECRGASCWCWLARSPNLRATKLKFEFSAMTSEYAEHADRNRCMGMQVGCCVGPMPPHR